MRLPASFVILPHRARNGIGVVLIGEDRQQLVPDLIASLVVRRAGSGESKASAQSAGLSQRSAYGVSTSIPSAGGSSYNLTAGSIAVTMDAVALRRITSGSTSTRAVAPSGSRSRKVAGLHAFFSEAGEDVGDVGQVGLVRADEEDAAPTVSEARVGVEEVRRPVQSDDGLAGSRSAVDDQSATRARADDRVLVGLDRAEHIPHVGRSTAAQARDEGGLVVESGVTLESFIGEHFVPVVADPAERPPIPATARQPHRVGVSGTEEGLGRRRTPIEQQPMPRPLSVSPSRPTYTDRSRPTAPCVPDRGRDRIDGASAAGWSAGRSPRRGPSASWPTRPALCAAESTRADSVGDRLARGCARWRQSALVGCDQSLDRPSL